jgi:anaerobic selenocysteine-containing dehydrogenase/Fe-S-cluster-containing dehydrogenase component
MSTKRRDLLKILGIGGVAGLTGCSTTAPDALVPYVVPPEEMVRGHALWFRSTCRECPAGCGIEARVREGRVHKVEGNPEHPVNGGGLCARGQAAVQGLYNPDRLRSPLVREGGKLKPVSWDEALKRVQAGLAGKPVTVISGSVTGAIEELAGMIGRHLQFEPIDYAALREANRICFGISSLPVLRFAEAKTIIVFGTDVIETFVSPVGYARGIAEARRNGARMVYVGSRLSLTGARADEWIPVQPGAEGLIIARLAKELRAEPSIAVAGGTASCDQNGLFTAVAVNRLNAAIGALNRTVRFDRTSALGKLASRAQLQAATEAVVVAGANPVYWMPDLFRKTPFVVALASCPDETTELAHVVLPIHTPLESWGDYEPWTGIHCLQQPAMRPVFDTRDLGDVLLRLANHSPETSFREFLRSRWREPEDFTTALQRGGYWRDVPEVRVTLKSDTGVAPSLERKPYVLQTYPSLAHFDGRGANRPWLQELPDPITQVVWDSWVEVNPQDAAKLGITTGDRVRVRSKHGEVETAAYVYPGIQPGAVAMPLGQGHTAFGRYATGVGVNVARLLGDNWSGEPVEISLVRKARDLVIIPGHDLQEGRGIVRTSPAEPHPEISLYPPHTHTPHRWAMAIDLDACNGCSACVTACYAENNVPVVGKEQVGRGRHMSWIRLERFFGPGSAVTKPLRIDYAPMMCQHCDKAPCEPVCPVFASVHSAEGLNAQIYNRCVGTRYCANNCPYKQRRFNWFPGEFPAPLNWQLNPDVTVRSTGVMEKCTFCVQRIVAAKDRARREGRPLADGDAVPACAQSCPTGAIVFGDLNNPSSRVSKTLDNPRRYTVLEELNTRPAVRYLRRERRA